jgi:hypothetical protein
VHRRFDVHDDALLQTAGWMRTDADHLDVTVVIQLADDCDHL